MIAFLLFIVLPTFIMAEEYWFPDSLSSTQLFLLDSIAQTYSIDDGCSGTISETKNSIACPDAKSFYNFAAWFVLNEKDADYIVDKLRTRNTTYFHPEKYNLAPSTMSVAGDTSSPVHIVAYVTSTCSHCKRVGIPLAEMVEGPLRGEADFVLKPIHHKIGDYALLAAAKIGKDWDLFKAFGELTSRIDETTVIEAAENAGIDTDWLKKDVDENNEEYQRIIAKNHSEAVKNGMKFTPALYFNGYRYRSNKHPIWLMEYIQYVNRTGILGK